MGAVEDLTSGIPSYVPQGRPIIGRFSEWGLHRRGRGCSAYVEDFPALGHQPIWDPYRITISHRLQARISFGQ